MIVSPPLPASEAAHPTSRPDPRAMTNLMLEIRSTAFAIGPRTLNLQSLMFLDLLRTRVFCALTGDVWLLFGTRCARLFAYGLLSVVLILYLRAAGLSESRIGLLLTLTLLGDTAISLWLT